MFHSSWDRLAVPNFTAAIHQQTRSSVRHHLKKSLAAFVEDEAGLTMAEYATAGALVTATAIAAFTGLGAAVVARITFLVTELKT
jgi:pilus assembly protein Flp/PilA